LALRFDENSCRFKENVEKGYYIWIRFRLVNFYIGIGCEAGRTNNTGAGFFIVVMAVGDVSCRMKFGLYETWAIFSSSFIDHERLNLNSAQMFEFAGNFPSLELHHGIVDDD